MVTKRDNPSSENHIRNGAFSPAGENRRAISPGERWLLITEKAYFRAQRRGFVGGDPFDDWEEAEREVDAIYVTDSRRNLLPADAEQLAEQVKSVFGGYGLGHLSPDRILEKHREAMELLAAHNRKLMDNTSELALQQSALFREAVDEAMETLHSFSQGRMSADGFAKQAEISKRALENLLTYFNEIAGVSAGTPSSKKTDSASG